jgi:hypothetical protein
LQVELDPTDVHGASERGSFGATFGPSLTKNLHWCLHFSWVYSSNKDKQQAIDTVSWRNFVNNSEIQVTVNIIIQ